MEAREELIRNVSTEYKNLYKNWMTKTPENLVASAHDINFFQEWHIMLTEDYFYERVNESIVEWLCSFDKPLQALLEIFLGGDCPSSYSRDDMIDWIEIVYSDATHIKLGRRRMKKFLNWLLFIFTFGWTNSRGSNKRKYI